MSNDKQLHRAAELAKSSIYNGARYIGKWNGCNVYEPTFADNKPRFIGFPQFIIAKGDDVRFTSSDDESRAILSAFASDDD